MTKLEDVSIETLREALDRAEEAKAAKRLTVAIAYKDGVSVETLSDRYGVPRSTVYYWLERLERQPISEAVTDAPRPGRPPKLSPEDRATVETWLAVSPRQHDIDADEWTPELLRDRIHETFDVDYSVGHVRRRFFG